MNILFTCAGRRNYLINYFKEAIGSNGKIYAADMQTTAPALVDADVAIKGPSIYSQDYIDFLKKTITDHSIGAVISLNDLELPILSKHKDVLSQTGATIIVSDEKAIDICFDKWRTVEFLESAGLKTPLTFIDLQEAKKAIQEGRLDFPVVVKPRWGSASIAVDFAEDSRELELIYELQIKKLEKTILSTASSSDKEHAILIQEKIKGVEYGMDVLNDFKGNYYETFAREKLSMRSGETDKAMSVVDNELSQIGKKIGSELKHIGNLDCDVFKGIDGYYVLELNPRFGGGYPFSHLAGIDTPSIYLEWLAGNDNVSQFDNYKAGISHSKCDRLIDISNK